MTILNQFKLLEIRSKKLAKALLLFAAFGLFSGSVLADDYCADLLVAPRPLIDKMKIISAFDGVTIASKRGYEGMSVIYKLGHGTRTVRLGMLDDFAKGPRKRVWYFNNQVYQFIDVGFKNFESQSERLNSIIGQHLINHPGENLDIEFGPNRRQAEMFMRRYRWLLHGEVIEVFKKKKKYISPEGFEQLEQVNKDSTNIDVFGLIKFDKVAASRPLSDEQIHDRLGMTLQISYYGERNFFDASLSEVLRAHGFEVPTLRVDQFPFETRLDPKRAYYFRERFYNVFDRHTTCEFTRLAKFAKDLPRPMVDRFIYEAFETAEKRGMKTFVASADSKTSRIFQHYGFKVYSLLPVPTDEEEVLLVIDVNSPHYQQVKNRLLDSALKVTVRLEGIK